MLIVVHGRSSTMTTVGHAIVAPKRANKSQVSRQQIEVWISKNYG